MNHSPFPDGDMHLVMQSISLLSGALLCNGGAVQRGFSKAFETGHGASGLLF